METPNYKMVMITSAIVIGLSALILILINALWIAADWSRNELLFLSQLVTIIGGMVLPGVVLLLSFLGQRKYASDKAKTKIIALINVTTIGVALAIAVMWLIATINLIAETYIGFYIGIIVCIVGSIAMLAYSLILEIQYLLQAKSSK